tara:strand:+ start:112 stop:519 length:408 start_codon:yes stop_codon:yes gene_type:complete
MTFDLVFWLTLALFVSIVINIFSFWYIRKILKTYFFVTENVQDLVSMIDNYSEHLKKVYAMDMYHGDETMNFLLSHTNSLLEMLEQYDDPESIIVPLEEIEIIEKDNQNNDEKEANPPPIDQENVFYAGSRRRDS